METIRPNSFIFHNDYIINLDLIENSDDFRLLIEGMVNYNSSGILPENLSPIAQMAFSFFKKNLDRDIEKYNKICKRNRENGSHGGRPRENPEKPKKPSGLSGNPKNPSGCNTNTNTKKKTKTKTINIYTEEFETFLAFYPERSGTDSKIAGWRQWQIRLTEGDTELEMIEGAKAYQAFNNATGKTNTQYVMTKAKFLGRDKHFKNNYEVKHGETDDEQIDRIADRIRASDNAGEVVQEYLSDV